MTGVLGERLMTFVDHLIGLRDGNHFVVSVGVAVDSHCAVDVTLPVAVPTRSGSEVEEPSPYTRGASADGPHAHLCLGRDGELDKCCPLAVPTVRTRQMVHRRHGRLADREREVISTRRAGEPVKSIWHRTKNRSDLRSRIRLLSGIPPKRSPLTSGLVRGNGPQPSAMRRTIRENATEVGRVAETTYAW